MSLNRLDEAGAVFRQAEDRKLESEELLDGRYQLAFLKGDTAEMERLVAQANGKPGIEDVLLGDQAETEAYHGRLGKARQLTQWAIDSAERNDAKETAAGYYSRAGRDEAYLGETSRSRADVNAALRLAPNRDVQVDATLAHALIGDTRAEKLADELSRSFPLDTRVQRCWLPTIRAALALQRERADEAIELLQVTAPYELSSPDPIYMRGQAFLTLRNGSSAAAEFQKLLDHRGIVLNSPLGALVHLGLARAYALSGDTAKARTKCQDFFALWKDADPDSPILKQAKAEYARLQ
ncbi:MAG TPA: hypothetical protein VEV41_27335 [Terriglobales bacterium]|nr:hypothetical protein [Terriglobales bacterium]